MAWAGSFAAMVLALLAPALWNGYPLIFADTGGYLERPFEHTLAVGRSAFYGAFLAAGLPLDFWPNVAVQAALAVWLMVLALRTHGLGGRPVLALAIVAALAVGTALPWFASQLMPDIFLPLAVLGLYLLAFCWSALRRFETAALIALVAAAIACHMAILGLSLVLLAAFAAAALLRGPWPRPRLLAPGGAVAAGVALALGSNLAITGNLAFTPGGEAFLFGRLLQDGIVQRYLDEHCPQASPELCPLRGELSRVADDWLWADDSPLGRLGGPQAFAPQEGRIILQTVFLYPGQHLATAAVATAQQFARFRTILSVQPWDNRDAVATIARHIHDFARFAEARQQREAPDIDWLNRLHVPLAVLALAGLVLAAAAGPARPLAVTVLVALLANAAICGIFSNVSDRYEARLIWLAPLAVAVAVALLRQPSLRTRPDTPRAAAR